MKLNWGIEDVHDGTIIAAFLFRNDALLFFQALPSNKGLRIIQLTHG